MICIPALIGVVIIIGLLLDVPAERCSKCGSLMKTQGTMTMARNTYLAYYWCTNCGHNLKVLRDVN